MGIQCLIPYVGLCMYAMEDVMGFFVMYLGVIPFLDYFLLIRHETPVLSLRALWLILMMMVIHNQSLTMTSIMMTGCLKAQGLMAASPHATPIQGIGILLSMLLSETHPPAFVSGFASSLVGYLLWRQIDRISPQIHHHKDHDHGLGDALFFLSSPSQLPFSLPWMLILPGAFQ